MFKKLAYWHYDFTISKILKEKIKLTRNEALPFYLLSLVCKRDIQQYVTAVISFLRYVEPEKIIIVNDGTLSETDKNYIVDIIGDNIEFRSLSEFTRPGLPTGGCWERIIAVSEYNESNYVMQLDADTLFMANPIELIESIKQQRSFCLPTISGYSTCNLHEAESFSKAMISLGGDYIQYDLEAALSIMGHPETNQYIRACAGLAGYAKGVITENNLLHVSDTYRKAFKERWDSWGTEQFVSNYILANTKDLRVLPVNKYNSVDMYSKELNFVHFIGTYRFVSGYYLVCSKQVLREVSDLKQ